MMSRILCSFLLLVLATQLAGCSTIPSESDPRSVLDESTSQLNPAAVDILTSGRTFSYTLTTDDASTPLPEPKFTAQEAVNLGGTALEKCFATDLSTCTFSLQLLEHDGVLCWYGVAEDPAIPAEISPERQFLLDATTGILLVLHHPGMTYNPDQLTEEWRSAAQSTISDIFVLLELGVPDSTVFSQEASLENMNPAFAVTTQENKQYIVELQQFTGEIQSIYLQ